MGSLRPGATYVYERVAGSIFAREMGSNDRKLVGYVTGMEPDQSQRLYASQMNDILLMCEKDPGMKELLDQLIVMYNLKKTHE